MLPRLPGFPPVFPIFPLLKSTFGVGSLLAIAFGVCFSWLFSLFRSAVCSVWGLCLRLCHNSISKCFSTALWWLWWWWLGAYVREKCSSRFSALRRVQLPFPFGAPEAADACGRHFHWLLLPRNSTPKTPIYIAPPHLYFQLLAM